MKKATYLIGTVFNGSGKNAVALEWHLFTTTADKRTRLGKRYAGKEADVGRLAAAINASGARLLATHSGEPINYVRIICPTAQAARLFAKTYNG